MIPFISNLQHFHRSHREVEGEQHQISPEKWGKVYPFNSHSSGEAIWTQ
jgi:hypothetical protein